MGDTGEFAPITTNPTNANAPVGQATHPSHSPAAEASVSPAPQPARPSEDYFSNMDEGADTIQPMKESHRRRPLHNRFHSEPATNHLIPMPSPPRLGLSELLAGSPTLREGDCYFSSTFSDATTNSRTPRTSTGDSASPGGIRSPRVQNLGGVLAPHGTFTSARRKPASPAIVTSSSLSDNSIPRIPALPRSSADEAEHQMLLKAASQGDQLAIYHLGWSSAAGPSRHTLGAIQDVWGPADSGEPSYTMRSNASSRTSYTYPGPEARAARTAAAKPSSDLFDDAARLTLDSNAHDNKPRAATTASYGTTPIGLYEYSRPKRKTKDRTRT